MMTTKKLITSDDPKGRQATDLFRGSYNKAQLTDEQAQRLNENRNGEFTSELIQLIHKHSNRVPKFTYPKEYLGPKPIAEQIKIIADMFKLDPGDAIRFSKKLPKLPGEAEGWFAIPSLYSMAEKHFPDNKDSGVVYCEAVKLVHEKLIENRFIFRNFNRNKIIPSQIRQHLRTFEFFEQLDTEQTGDILIVAAQYGMRHSGKSVSQARETFIDNEFGLGSFAVGCMALVHPERYVKFDELGTDCPGDEYAEIDGVFSRSTSYNSRNHELRFNTCDVEDACESYGSVSAFMY